MKTVDDLIQELKSLKVKRKGFEREYETEVIYPNEFHLVENAIREFLLDHHDSEIGEMQGKIFVYEEIIKKSNFAPIMPDNHLQDILLSMQRVISEYENEKLVREIPTSPLKEETEETPEKETMFYSEFQKSDEWCNSNFVGCFDLSGNAVVPKKRDKILKYYKREVGNFKILIVFIGKE